MTTDLLNPEAKGFELSNLGITLINKTIQEVTGEVSKPLTNLFGSGNIKDVIALLCGLVNTAARRSGVVSYLGLLPDVFAAVSGFDMVLEEVIDLTEEEYAELKQFAIDKLDLPEAKELELLAEGVVYHALGLLMIVVRYFRAIKATKSVQ